MMYKILLVCLFMLVQLDLIAQTKICINTEQIGSHTITYDDGDTKYSFNVRSATGSYGWYVTSIDNMEIYHFIAYSPGVYEIEVVKKFWGIVLNRTLFSTYSTWGTETYSSPVTGTFEGKGQTVDLIPGFYANSQSGTANIFLVCNSGLRIGDFFDENEMEFSFKNDLPQPDNAIYPNPVASGWVNFGKVEEYFQVFDATGVLIKSGTNSAGFEVSDFPKGIYLIVRNGKTERLIVE